MKRMAAALGLITFLLVLPAFAAEKPVALFDQGHGQRFTIEGTEELDLGGLAAIFRQAGFDVRITYGQLTPEILADVDAVVTSGGFQPFTTEEVVDLLTFMRRGGSLAVMLHIAPTYQHLLEGMGVRASAGVIHESEGMVGNMGLDFKVDKITPGHPLFDGLEGFDIYGGWALLPMRRGVEVIAVTSDKAWLDMDRDRRRNEEAEPMQRFAVAVASREGEGKYVVFGDDAIFQNRFLETDNRKLAENLARWFLPAPGR